MESSPRDLRSSVPGQAVYRLAFGYSGLISVWCHCELPDILHGSKIHSEKSGIGTDLEGLLPCSRTSQFILCLR